MNLKYYQLCDDWGWFIDIEHDGYGQNILIQQCRSPVKKFNSRLDKLPAIEEDEYEYYQKNYKDPEEKYDINLRPKSNKIKENTINKMGENTLFNVGCTTLITAVLTYFIFVVL